MKAPRAYPPSSLSRIKGLGEKAVTEFLGSTPVEARQSASKLLPAMRGFRPGTTAARERQIQDLARKLLAHRSAKTISRENTALYSLWRGWCKSHLPDVPAVQDLLEQLNDYDPEADNSETGEQVRTALEKLVMTGACARETLQRFLTFSPFEEIDELMALADSARSEEEISRESVISGLPDRLYADEARLKDLEKRVAIFEQSSRETPLETRNIQQSIAALRAEVGGLQTAVKGLDEALKAVVVRNSGAINDLRTTVTGLIDDLIERVDQVDKTVALTAEREQLAKRGLKEAAEARQQLSQELTEQRDQLTEIEGKIASHVASLVKYAPASEVEGISARLHQFENGLGELTDVGLMVEAVSERLHQFENRLVELTDVGLRVEAVVRPSMDASPQGAAPASQFERLMEPRHAGVNPHHSRDQVLKALEGTLTDIGLVRTAAATFSEEIFAAILSRQIPFFRGGWAVDVARQCALALSGVSAFRVAFPMGALDPAPIRAQFRNLPEVAGQVPSIVIEGINTSPIEVSREILLDLVTDRVGGFAQQRPTIVLAALSDGPGAFPWDSLFLELGPVFDLEQLNWRRRAAHKAVVPGSVSVTDWEIVTKIEGPGTANAEEVLKTIQELAHRRSARFEANVLRALQALETVHRADGSTTVLQSITFGWLLPYWQSTAVAAEEIDARIDGGKWDAATPDVRLQRALAEYRAANLSDNNAVG